MAVYEVLMGVFTVWGWLGVVACLLFGVMVSVTFVLVFLIYRHLLG